MDPTLDRPSERLLSPRAARIVVALAALTLLVFAFTKHRIGANVLSRFITVERLLEAGTFSHEHTPFTKSVDAVQVDGRLYSSKPPTFTLVITALAWPIRALSGASLYEYQRPYLAWLVLVHQVLPYILLLWVALRWIERETPNAWTQTITLLGLSFAILPYGYAVTLNNHTPAAIFLFFMWLATERLMRGEFARANLAAIAIGVLGGLAASYELTAGIFTPLFGLLLATRRFHYGLLVAAGALTATIPMFATYYAISGSIVPFYIRPELYDFPGSYWRSPTGMDALNDPKWLYLWNSMLGHHGMFSLTPFLGIGVAGLILKLRRGHLLSGAVLVGSVVVVIYIVSTTNNYGGRTLGMRWFAQFAPLFVLGAVPALEWMRTRTLWRRVCYVLLAVSAAAVVEALIQNAFSPGGWVYGLQKVL